MWIILHSILTVVMCEWMSVNVACTMSKPVFGKEISAI